MRGEPIEPIEYIEPIEPIEPLVLLEPIEPIEPLVLLECIEPIKLINYKAYRGDRGLCPARVRAAEVRKPRHISGICSTDNTCNTFRGVRKAG